MLLFGLIHVAPETALKVVGGAILAGLILDLLPWKAFYPRAAFQRRPVLPADRTAELDWTPAELHRLQQRELARRRRELPAPHRMLPPPPDRKTGRADR